MGRQRRQGVAYITYGDASEREMAYSLDTLRRFHDWPLVQMRSRVPGMTEDMTGKQKSRLAKVTMLDWTPWDDTLYLDADTRINGDLSAGFRILDDGWDMAMAFSENQGHDWLWHVLDDDRALTKETWDGLQALQLQCGVMFVRKNEATRALFDAWRREWAWHKDEDQAAFLRAWRESPVRLWLLGRAWNGGGLVAHYHGRVR